MTDKKAPPKRRLRTLIEIGARLKEWSSDAFYTQELYEDCHTLLAAFEEMKERADRFEHLYIDYSGEVEEQILDKRKLEQRIEKLRSCVKSVLGEIIEQDTVFKHPLHNIEDIIYAALAEDDKAGEK